MIGPIWRWSLQRKWFYLFLFYSGWREKVFYSRHLQRNSNENAVSYVPTQWWNYPWFQSFLHISEFACDSGVIKVYPVQKEKRSREKRHLITSKLPQALYSISNNFIRTSYSNIGYPTKKRKKKREEEREKNHLMTSKRPLSSLFY